MAKSDPCLDAMGMGVGEGCASPSASLMGGKQTWDLFLGSGLMRQFLEILAISGERQA